MQQKAKAQLSGGRRRTLAGKTSVNLGLAEAEAKILREAAKSDGRPLTQFLTYHGLEAAKRILAKSR